MSAKRFDFIFKRVLILLAVVSISYYLYAQGVVISTSGAATPDASSMLDIQSTSAGILIPRMTEAQRTPGISSPAEGLLVYQTDGEEGFYYYDGSNWKCLMCTSESPAPDYNHTWGSDYTLTVSEAESTTQSSSGINKVTLAFASPADGNYMIECFWELNESGGTTSSDVYGYSRVWAPTTTDMGFCTHESGSWITCGSFYEHTVSASANFTAMINYYRQISGSNKCRIRRARIKVYRSL